MPSLQIRDVDPRLIKRLKDLARREHRTLSHQVLFVLEQYLQARDPGGRDLATAASRIRDFWSEAGEEAPELTLPSREDEPGRTDMVDRILEED